MPDMGLDIYQPAPVYPNERERERAIEASGVLSLSDDPDLQRIVEHVRDWFGTSMAALSIVYRDWQYLIATAGLPGGPYSRRTSFCGHAILEAPNTFCVSDALLDRRFANNPSVKDNKLVRFYAGAPLVNEQGLPLGVLCVFDPGPRECFGGVETDQLRSCAGAAMKRIAALKRGSPALRPTTTDERWVYSHGSRTVSYQV